MRGATQQGPDPLPQPFEGTGPVHGHTASSAANSRQRKPNQTYTRPPHGHTAPGAGWGAGCQRKYQQARRPCLLVIPPPQNTFEFIGSTRSIPRVWGFGYTGTRLAVVYRSAPVVGRCGCPVWLCKGVWGSLGFWGGTGGERPFCLRRRQLSGWGLVVALAGLAL